MWTEKTNAGRYKYTERIAVAPGKYKKVSVTLDKNTAQARKVAERLLQEKAEAMEPTKAKCMSVLIEDYIKEQARTVREGTVKRNSITLRLLCKMLNDPRSDQITAGMIRSALLKEDHTITWMNEYISRFKAFWRWAYRNDYVSSVDPAEKLKKFEREKSHKEEIADKYLEADELKSVLKECDVYHWQLVIEFLALTGLRFGEFAALERDDVSDTEISITKTFNCVTGQCGAPKTYTSIRTLHVQPELKECIRKIRAYTAQNRFKSEAWRNTRLFFPNPTDGSYVSLAAFDKYFKLLTESTVGRKLTAHALRHTHASLLMAAGYDIEAIARRLGHGSNSKITREIYLHVTSKLKQQDADRLDQIRIIS